MAITNFSRLTTQELTAWSNELWQAQRNRDFLSLFEGEGPDAMIQRITTLRKTTKGVRAVITLVNDMEGDGTVGDNQLEGFEEELRAYDQVIRVDQIRNANRLAGRMADQKSIINFREQSRDKLAYWLAERRNQLAMLTLSGLAYNLRLDGSPRNGSPFNDLDFAADVTAPTTNRYRRWSAASGLLPGDTTAITSADTLKWNTVVDLKAYAIARNIRPITTDNGIQVFNLFVSPQAMSSLKKDPTFIAAYQYAGKRGDDSILFKGTGNGGRGSGVYIDGVNILEYKNVFTTVGAAAGSKWGAGGNVDGSRLILAGAQALAFADLGMPMWDEKMFDYDNSLGIAVAAIIGYKKPVFRSLESGTDEDFGSVVCDVAI